HLGRGTNIVRVAEPECSCRIYRAASALRPAERNLSEGLGRLSALPGNLRANETPSGARTVQPIPCPPEAAKTSPCGHGNVWHRERLLHRIIFGDRRLLRDHRRLRNPGTGGKDHITGRHYARGSYRGSDRGHAPA